MLSYLSAHRLRLHLFITVCVSILLPTLSWAQGSNREDRAQVQSELEVRTPTTREGNRPAVVDLRYALPAVGSQSMNDCVGWAYGYAARTYLEAIDQGWTPDSPERIFSPTFIYNQINGGKDEGSNPIKAVELLRDLGASTLRWFPYRPKDYTTDPLSRRYAVSEAELFRIQDFRIVTSGEAMREALAAGDIVCIGVRTNPVFNAASFGVYTPAIHEQGKASRRPGQPHGYHAMVVAGYDDNKGAFLLMNSWGQGWGHGGYIWVDYAVADTFNLNRSEEHLIDYAIVMTDVRQPVLDTGTVYKPLEVDQIQVDARFRARESTAQGEVRYDLKLDIIGPQALGNNVQRIRWTYQSTEGTERTLTTTDSRAIVTAAPGPQRVVAEVMFKDGRRFQRETSLNLPDRLDRPVSLQRVDAFSHYVSPGDGRGPAGWTEEAEPLFRVTYVPEMSALNWADLERIEWFESRKSRRYVGSVREGLEEFPYSVLNTDPLKPLCVYEHQRETGVPSTDEPTLAYPSGVYAIVPKGKAVFKFRDGSEVSLALPDDAFPEPPMRSKNYNESTFTYLTRPVGMIDGEEWYHYELRVFFPERWQAYFVDGVFELEGFEPEKRTQFGQLTRGIEPLALLKSGYARSSFKAQGEVRFRKGAPRTLFEGPLPQVKMDQLMVGKRAQSLVVGHGEIDIDGVPHGFRYLDTYLGLDDQGHPLWRVEPWFLDWRQKGFWRDIDDYTQWKLSVPGLAITPRQNPNADDPDPTILTTEPFTLSASGTFSAGQGNGQPPIVTTETRSLEVQPRTPAHRGIHLRATAGGPDHLRNESAAESGEWMRVEAGGPEREVQQVSQITHLIEQSAGWVYPLPVSAFELARGSEEASRTVLPRPPRNQPARALFHLADGGLLAAEGTVVEALPFPDVPLLHTEAISRYAGSIDGVPHWQVSLRLGGRLDELAHVRAVRFAVETEAAEALDVEPGPDLTASVLTPVPVLIRAIVSFDDHRPEEIYPAVAFTPSEQIQPDGEWRITAQRLRIDRPYGPNPRNDMHSPMPEVFDAIMLRAPVHDLETVRAVRYTVPDYSSPTGTSVREVSRNTPPQAGLPVPPGMFATVVSRSDSPDYGLFETRIPVTVVLVDGREVELPDFVLPEDTSDVVTIPSQSLEMSVVPVSREPAKVLTAWRAVSPPVMQSNFVGWQWEFPAESGLTLPESLNWPGGWTIAETAQPIVPTQVVARAIDRKRDFRAWKLRFNPKTSPESAPYVEWRPDEVTVEPVVGGHRISPDFQGEAFEEVAEVWHEVERDGQTLKLTPLAWYGPAHERFAATLTGARPDRVVTHLRTASGERRVLGEWRP